MADHSWGLSYKQLQDNFVSNLNGTSLLEIGLVVSTAPLCVLFRSCFGALFWGNMASYSIVHSSFVFILDYMLLILPIIMVFSVLVNYIITILITMSVMIFTSIIIKTCFTTDRDPQNLAHQHSQKHRRQPFICNFRAYVLIATAVSILAVDFHIYPRRFAKAETYGSGLMDVGVGAFIVSNAIVSPEARNTGKPKSGLLSAVLKSIKSSLPLLVLGLSRFLAVKSTDYQTHVSEYGVHWNFFLTLFVVRVLSTLIVHMPILGNPSTYGITGCIIAVSYQYCLTVWGLESYIIHGVSSDGVRHGLVDANREGLSSCIGYLALYFMALQLGRFLFAKRDSTGSWFVAFLFLVLLDVVFWILTATCKYYLTPVSRRMANLTFVLWQMAYNIQLLSSFLLVDLVVKETMPQNVKPAGCDVCYPDSNTLTREPIRQPHCACMIAAINRNQLAYFLIANLLTGLVNFTVKTLYCTQSQSLWIINGYMILLNAIFVILHAFDITLKIH